MKYWEMQVGGQQRNLEITTEFQKSKSTSLVEMEFQKEFFFLKKRTCSHPPSQLHIVCVWAGI
jgi:hypothetical protein